MAMFAASGDNPKNSQVTKNALAERSSVRDPEGAPGSPQDRTRIASRYYVLVLVPESGGRWLAQFPDLPGCRAVGEQVELTICEAAAAASKMLQGIRDGGMEPPAPRSFEEVRADTAWAETRSIEWSKALISIVAIA